MIAISEILWYLFVLQKEGSYVEGFGWIESQGPNYIEYAADMYENGNKIGSMG